MGRQLMSPTKVGLKSITSIRMQWQYKNLLDAYFFECCFSMHLSPTRSDWITINLSISTSALLHPKEYYSMRPVHFTLAFIHLGCVGLQILARVALVDGVSQYMFSIYRNLLGFVMIGPLAFCMERSAGSIYSSSISCLFFLPLSGFHNIRGATLANYLSQSNFQ